MKKHLLAAAMAATALTGCEKEPVKAPQKDPCTTGRIQFVNNSKHPYNVYVNGNLTIQQKGGQTGVNDFAPGYYTVKVVQVSGYAVYPTEKTYTGTLEGCGTLVFSYP